MGAKVKIPPAAKDRNRHQINTLFIFFPPIPGFGQRLIIYFIRAQINSSRKRDAGFLHAHLIKTEGHRKGSASVKERRAKSKEDFMEDFLWVADKSLFKIF